MGTTETAPAPATVSARPGYRVWLAALLPLVPVALALAVVPAPDDPRVIRLDGAWQFASLDDADARQGDGLVWRPFSIPGHYSDDAIGVMHGYADRHFTLDAAPDRDLFVMIPNTAGFAKVYVNGALVGEKGVPESGFSLDIARLDGFAVPMNDLRQGENVLRLEVINPNPNNSISDARFLLGPPEVVKTYLDRAQSVKFLLEFGALMINMFGIALVAYLLARGDGNRALYRSALSVMAVLVLYMMGKTGIFVGFVFDTTVYGKFTLYTIIGIAFTTPELIESYYLGDRKPTWFRKLNRVVCVLWFVAALIFGIRAAYKPMSPWLFIVIIHALVLCGRDLWKPRTDYGPVLATAIAVTAATGASDLLTDLNVLYAPRLFSYGVTNLGVIAVVLVLGELVRLGKTLQLKNRALVDALAKAEETARLKSEFLANTSHELRTPLNAILNIPQGLLHQIEERGVVVCHSCQALFEADVDNPVAGDTECPSCGKVGDLAMELRRFAPDDGDALGAHLRSIIGAGEHLLAVVNDILDFSKLDAGKMQLATELVAVDDIVTRAVATVMPVAQAADVTLQAAPAGKEVAVQADVTRMTQVLINLLANAVKFSPPGGVVDVEAARENGAVLLRVRDRGVGIAPENHAMIFESFRQVESGHTRKHGGTGLGLAIVKKLVTMHGGEISVDSAIGKGATFTVKLPVQNATLGT